MKTGTVKGVSDDYRVRIIPADADNSSGGVDALREKLRRSGWQLRGKATVEGMPGAQVWARLTPEAVQRRLVAAKAKAAKAAKAKAKRKASKAKAAKASE